MSIYRTVGARIRDERRRAGLTLDKLAEAVGISTSYLTYIERGRRRPHLETIERLAVALDVPVSSLINGPKSSEGGPAAESAREFVRLIRWLSPGQIEIVLGAARGAARALPVKNPRKPRRSR